MVRLTDQWSPARELAFTTACNSFSFCASLVSASVSGGLGRHAALRAATELPQSLSHLRHTGGLAARSSHRTSTSFPGPIGLLPARQKALVARLIEPLGARNDQFSDIVERSVMRVGPTPICFLVRHLS